jgi:hypothetical protein
MRLEPVRGRAFQPLGLQTVNLLLLDLLQDFKEWFFTSSGDILSAAVFFQGIRIFPFNAGH